MNTTQHADRYPLNEGDSFTLHGSQVTGCYIRDDGKREAHFAVPGRWSVILREGTRAVLGNASGERFECYAPNLLAILGHPWSVYDAAAQRDLFYCRAGAGFILYDGRQALWETVTERDMLDYLREHGLQAEYRVTHIVIIR